MTEEPKKPEELKNAFVDLCVAVILTIRDIGPMGAPRGALYATLMVAGATYDQYLLVEETILATGMVRKDGDVLVWEGGR